MWFAALGCANSLRNSFAWHTCSAEIVASTRGGGGGGGEDNLACHEDKACIRQIQQARVWRLQCRCDTVVQKLHILRSALSEEDDDVEHCPGLSHISSPLPLALPSPLAHLFVIADVVIGQ